MAFKLRDLQPAIRRRIRDQLAADAATVHPVAADSPQPALPCPLVRRVQKCQKGRGGLEILVTLIACRRRFHDDDSNVIEFKALRDAIAESLGLDDADRRIRFEYGQTETRGRQGVIIRIEMVSK
jgi:hypothetical protein